MKTEEEIQAKLQELYQILANANNKLSKVVRSGTKKDQNDVRGSMIQFISQINALHWVIDIQLPENEEKS